MSDKKGIFWRVYLIYFAFVGIMLVVLGKTFALQVDSRSEVFTTNVDNQKLPTRTIKRIPRRGDILDANMKPLITSVSFYDIHMDPTVVDQELFDKNISDLCKGLAQIAPKRDATDWERYIRSARTNNRRYITIKRKATIEERKKLRQLPIFKEGRLDGGIIDNEESIIRKRPHGELFKRTLGYYRPSEEQVSELRVGLEGAFNEYLAGSYGEEVQQKYANGWKRTGQIIREAVEGADVITSIDLSIQEVAHNELKRQLKYQDAKHGSVIVMDVKTGFVKALVSLTKSSDGDYHEVYNHAIGTKGVPGSTFKLASLMALLEDEKVKVTDQVKVAAEYRFYNNVMKDHVEGSDYMSIKQAFEKSSNVFTKIVNNAYKNNPQAFINRLKSFGLADKLDLDIKGEVTPTLYDPSHPNWSGLSLPWMAVGYEVQQTPMQTLAFYNAVANNGTFVKPQFVKSIRRGQEIVKTFKPVILHQQICSQETIEVLKFCMEGVMVNGTGKNLKSSYFKTAGKTGTARIIRPNKGKDDSFYKYRASFVGYFPADKPMYSCIVVIAEPRSDIYGAIVSGTVFASIANKVYASSLEYHKAINESEKKKTEAPVSKGGNKQDLVNTLTKLNLDYTIEGNSQWIYSHKNGLQINIKNRYVGKNTTPNVIGMTAKDAVFLLERAGYRVKLNGYGVVKAQSIPAGTNSIKKIVILTLE